MNKPDTKAKAKRKRHKPNKKKPKANPNAATAAATNTSLDNEAAAADDNNSICGDEEVDLAVPQLSSPLGHDEDYDDGECLLALERNSSIRSFAGRSW